MRQIIFRAWDKEKILMLYDDVQDWVKNYRHIKLGDWLHDTVWRIGKLNNTLMQYTELKDKKGNRIFEDDIIQCDENWKGKVYFCNESLSWMVNDHLLSELLNPEVIGNIYQHPHILEN